MNGEKKAGKQVKIYGISMGRGLKGKKEHKTGRALLALGLFREYGIKGGFVLEKREKGKPFLPEFPDIHFNLSHSHGLVACAFGPMELGFDVQYHEPVDVLGLMARVMPQEQFSEVLTAHRPTEAFYRQWCLREAYMKWTGEGFSLDPRRVDFGKGYFSLIELEKGCTCALWAGESFEAEVVWVEKGELASFLP